MSEVKREPSPWDLNGKVGQLREFIQRKKILRAAYRAVFLGADGKPNINGNRVLAHLYRFCGVGDSAVRRGADGKIDPLALAYAQGQHDVYRAIQLHLNLDDSDLYQLDRAERAQQTTKE